jgi:alpha-amylase/alpha-mannosidase (GH57 family)
MSASKRLNVVLCWHMHQPEYRDLLTGQYLQPWTYLHAVKDYTDMAGHLESCPGARAVVNFVPIVLEQIAEYHAQIAAFLDGGPPIRDPLLAALANDSVPISTQGRMELAQMCRRANEQRVIQRFQPYADLVETIKSHQEREKDLDYLNDQFFRDLLVWYHLAWLGETIRHTDVRVQRLMDKSRHFTHDEQILLLRVLCELIGGIPERYRKLAANGQVELSMTPYAHPMLPLLVDFKAAREALPDIHLPPSSYPGGIERVHWHIETGLQSFNESFGIKPIGCWPSEGGISDAILPILVDHGFRWVASGQTVLRHSLERTHRATDHGAWPYRPYRLCDLPLQGFFRDDGLSDAIGFTYSDWQADDAVADLIHRLKHIASQLDAPDQHVVSIIMDGENAWEHYPDNGYHFLTALYKSLSQHPAIHLTTYREFLDDNRHHDGKLPSVCAGSWVYGTFSTWIGDVDKNRAWEILTETKRIFDKVTAHTDFSEQDLMQLNRQLAICEGSDWFWWFGDYNPIESIEDFSELYRRHIKNLHHMLGEPPPKNIDSAFGRGGVAEQGGVMRRGGG